jgi:ABC-type multidrug transport system ATPase subunit
LKEWEQIPPSAQQRLIYGDKLSDVKSVGTNAKLLLGIYNYEWDLGENIWSYLNRIREANPAIWERTFAVEIPNEGCGYADGVAVIPRNSQELLLENLNIGENISILARQRVCYGKSDIVDRHLQRKLAEDICRKYGFPKPSHSLKELNEIQRKLLSIVRFEVLHPTVIFLETPYQGIRPEEADTIRKCMYGLAEKHIKIVYFSQSLENMARDCREIWQVYENKVQNLTPFE